VAVADWLDVSGDFFTWFTENSKQIKMTTSHIGPSVGKKPTQTRYSQRKTKPPVLTCTTNPSSSSRPNTSSSVQSLSNVGVTGMSSRFHFPYPFGPGPNPW